MNEYENWLQDYYDCLDKIRNFERYNYNDIKIWSTNKCLEWARKNEKYRSAITVGTIKPLNNKEEAENAIYNLKTTLEKIAIINNFKM